MNNFKEQCSLMRPKENNSFDDSVIESNSTCKENHILGASRFGIGPSLQVYFVTLSFVKNLC